MLHVLTAAPGCHTVFILMCIFSLCTTGFYSVDFSQYTYGWNALCLKSSVWYIHIHILIQSQFTNEIYPFWKKTTVLMFYLKKKSGGYSLRKDKYLSFLDLAFAPVPCSLWVFPGLGAFGHVLGVSFPVVIWSSAQCKYWARTQTLHRSKTSQQENTIWSICFPTEAEGIDDGGKRLKRLASVRLHTKLMQHYQVFLKTPPQQVVVNLLYR